MLTRCSQKRKPEVHMLTRCCKNVNLRFICLLDVAKSVKIQNRTVVYMGQYHKHAKHRLHLPSEHLSFESYYALDIRFIPMNGQ